MRGYASYERYNKNPIYLPWQEVKLKKKARKINGLQTL